MTENESKYGKVVIVGGGRNAGRTMQAQVELLARIDELEAYRAIGTIEEFKALKEKSVAKKPIDKSKNPTDWHVMACPCCEHVFWNSGQFVHYEPKFCNYCGQKLDWQ